jgi:hypothetical protein
LNVIDPGFLHNSPEGVLLLFGPAVRGGPDMVFTSGIDCIEHSIELLIDFIGGLCAVILYTYDRN